MQKIHSSTELLADEIAQKISAKIQNQQYKAGEHLTVRRLCEEYGTSETPVKQALNQLVSTGLVVSVPKCGMRVRNFGLQDMKDICETRLMIEQYCARFAIEAAKRDEEFVTRLEETLRISNEEYGKCIQEFEKGNFIPYNALHYRDNLLHIELVKCCRNQQIINIYKGLNIHAGMFAGFHCHTPQTLQSVREQHTEIVDRLLLCDEEGLKKAISEHIYSTIRIYRFAWEK